MISAGDFVKTMVTTHQPRYTAMIIINTDVGGINYLLTKRQRRRRQKSCFTSVSVNDICELNIKYADGGVYRLENNRFEKRNFEYFYYFFRTISSGCAETFKKTVSYR